jgi:hypothetical protein
MIVLTQKKRRSFRHAVSEKLRLALLRSKQPDEKA